MPLIIVNVEKLTCKSAQNSQQESHHRDELANVNFLWRRRIHTTKYKKRKKLS